MAKRKYSVKEPILPILRSVRTIRVSIESDPDFRDDEVSEFGSECSILMSAEFEDEQVMADAFFRITTMSYSEQMEMTSEMRYCFLFYVPDVESRVIANSEIGIFIEADLQAACAAVAYSTSRGLMIGHMANSSFSRFILPSVGINDLLYLPTDPRKTRRDTKK